MRKFRQIDFRPNTAKCRIPSFALMRKRYKRKSENKHNPSLFSVPASNVMQLYGLDGISSSAKKEVDQAEQYKKKCPNTNKVVELMFWSWIGFSFAQAGAYLSKSIRSIGKVLCDVIGYSAVYLHPSLISLSIGKISKLKNPKIGITRYFEAGAVAELPAGIIFFATIGKIIQSSPTVGISIGRAIAAAAASSLAACVVWCSVFPIYWKKIVRGESWRDLIKNKSQYPKGFVSALKYPNDKNPKGAYEEAGAMVGTGFYLWVMPWYTVRALTAAVLAIQGATTENFNYLFFSATGAIEGISFFLKGMVISRVKSILKSKQIHNPKPETED
jgi:hypothetical protein